MSNFIRNIAGNRIAAQQLAQVDAPKADGADKAKKGQPLQAPDLRPGGRPVPKKQGGGLNAAMMRQTISDVFQAGEKLGLTGPQLARHSASIATLTKDIKGLEMAFARGLANQPEETRSIFRNLPAEIIGEMSAGLQALDPAGAAKSISHILNAIADIVKGDLPSGDQLRGMIGLAHSAGQLESGAMGEIFAAAAKSINQVGLKGPGLQAVVQQMALGMGAIKGAGGVREPLFNVTFNTMMKALNGDGDIADIAKSANKAAGQTLTDGQVQISIDQATAGRALLANLDAQVKQAEQQLEQAKGVYDANLAGPMAAKLEPLKDVRAQASELLSPKGQAVWHHEMNTHGAQPDKVVQGLGRFLLSYLARVGRESIPDAVVKQAAQHFVALGQIEGMTADHLNQLATEHTGAVDHVEIPGTLAQLGDILNKVTPEARTKLLAAGPVEADGSLALTAMANTLSGRADRYAHNQGPKPTLIATLNGAADAKTLTMVARRGVRFASEIPNTENGGIVERLRAHLPEDMKILAAAEIDPSVIGAAHPTLPTDSLPRLLAIGVKGKRDTDTWVGSLEKYFKNARGNKEHGRNLRTLLAAAADAGVDATKIVDAFDKSGISAQVLTKTVSAMLSETSSAPDKAYLDNAIKVLNKGSSPLNDIQARLQDKLMKEMNLEALVGDANINVTEHGLDLVKGPLATFFKNGVGKPQVPQDILKGFLVAVLEDRSDAFRFTTPVAEAHLGPLSDSARKAWLEPQVMMHVRFEGEGEAKFHGRVADSAKLGKLLSGRMEKAWGKLDDLKTQQADLAGKLRNVNKNDNKARGALVREIRGLPAKIKGLEWASQVASMTADNITPSKFLQLGDSVMDMRRLVGPAGAKAIDALQHSLKMSDISYSQVVTDDGPGFDQIFKLATTACLNWPGYGGEVLGYQADPNKRFLITKNQAGEHRRSVMRIVERQDEGHVGEPMLILERTYPDSATQEEKQRLMEHTIRRAAQMGVPCGFATEYYWNGGNEGARGGVDMKAVLEDLSKRYGTDVDDRAVQLLNRASNFSCDYLDSNAPGGAAGAGRVSYRGHKEKTDKAFENRFIVMTPQ